MVNATAKAKQARLDDLCVLFVEDEAITRDMLPRYLARHGARILSANDGLDGLRLFEQHRPQLVISDIRMPNMDGIAMCRSIREIDPDVPIIFLSAHNENDLLHSSIELGITRYLTIPVDISALMETITTATLAHQNRQRALEDLRKAISEATSENERLNTYVEHYLNTGRHKELHNIRHLDIPKDKVSGDFFCVTHHENTLYALVADGTGHGLSAVVPVLQVPRIFRAMAAKNFSLLAIADEINRELRGQHFTGHFLAATLIRMNPRDEFIEVLNFGNPAAFLLGREGKILHEFSPNTFALGVVNSEEFSAPIEHYKCARPASLYIFTDGLTDTLSSAHPDLGRSGLRRLFEETPPDSIYATLEKLIGDAAPHDRQDDITLVEIQFDGVAENAGELPCHVLGDSAPRLVVDAMQAHIGSATVLLVEDDEAERYHLAQFLEQRVSMLFKASNNEEGLASFAKHRPQLVIADIGMPTLSNLNMIEAIRKLDPEVPVIITGTACNETAVEKMLELGIAKFLPKPISKLKLTCAIVDCIQRHRISANAWLSTSVFASLPLGVLITNRNKEIIAVNPAFCRITGYTQDEIIGRNPSLLSSGKQDTNFYRAMWQAINVAGVWSGEIWNRCKNGELYLERVSINTVNDVNGEVSHYIATFTDITSHKSDSQNIECQIAELK